MTKKIYMYRIKPEEHYIFNFEKAEAEGRGLY